MYQIGFIYGDFFMSDYSFNRSSNCDCYKRDFNSLPGSNSIVFKRTR